MNFDKIVVNASPIISLTKIAYGDLMVDLSSDLVVPAGVFEEILFYGHHDPAVQWVQQREAEVVRSVEVPSNIAEWNLGKGESEVLAFAHQEPEFVASLDDRPAKKCAELYQIKVRGTIGLILKAKQAGVISKVEPLLLKLKAGGFRVSDGIYRKALRRAGEA